MKVFMYICLLFFVLLITTPQGWNLLRLITNAEITEITGTIINKETKEASLRFRLFTPGIYELSVDLETPVNANIMQAPPAVNIKTIDWKGSTTLKVSNWKRRYYSSYPNIKEIVLLDVNAHIWDLFAERELFLSIDGKQINELYQPGKITRLKLVKTTLN